MPIVKVPSWVLLLFHDKGSEYLAIILNHTLYTYGGEHSVMELSAECYVCFVSILELHGISIAGFNYGAEIIQEWRKVYCFQ
jgi:hypothetical protein